MIAGARWIAEAAREEVEAYAELPNRSVVESVQCAASASAATRLSTGIFPPGKIY